ncbi:MAG TPA: DNA polymerase III subunit delta [Acidimicrobiales bacterium]|nr:DNA polymerase III subunit delta [Acidimicrobiales bacterium]
MPGSRDGAAGTATAPPAPKPAYLVRGDDATLLAEAVRTLVATLVGGDDASLVVEDMTLDTGDGPGVANVLDACLTPPFLTQRRVVVAREAGRLVADDAARLLAYLAQPLDTSVLVLVAGGGTIPQKLVAEIKKVGVIVEAGLPRAGRDRTSWMVERLKDAPVTLDAGAGRLLGDHLGEDLSRLPGILRALEGAYGPGARLAADDVEPFLGEAGSVAPWDLTDAIDHGDYAAALDALHRLLGAGDRHPLVVMSTLHRHFSAMLRLDGSGARGEADAAELLGLKSTFPAKKALAQTRRLGSARVRRAIGLLAEADLDLRGAKAWPPELVMEVLVARLCQLSKV